MSEYPLPPASQAAIKNQSIKARNIGLLLDRFIAWDKKWEFDEKKSSGKKGAFRQVIDTANAFSMDPGCNELINSLRRRQEELLQSLIASGYKSWSIELKTDWRLTIGLGTPGVLETGLTTHRIYGFPFIPGSALKGLTSAWAETEGDRSSSAFCAIFGSQDVKDAEAGGLVFFDALPTTPPLLKMDVMNPHYGKYYQREETFPVEWLTPVPVYFLTVEKTSFLFSIASRKKEANDLVEIASKWLLEALANMGTGGKTTAGYGYFTTPLLDSRKPHEFLQVETPSQPVSEQPQQTTLTTSVLSAQPEKPLIWKTAKVKHFKPGQIGVIIPEDDPEKIIRFRQSDVQGKGWSPKEKIVVEFAIQLDQNGNQSVIIRKH